MKTQVVRNVLFPILCLLIVLIFSVILHAQPPKNTTRNSLIHQINNDAKRDVASNKEMQTDAVVNRYRDNNAGLTVEEIAKIYRRAYSYFKTFKEIQLSAKRHVEIKEGMQTDSVVNLYRDNTVGLTPKQIADYYERCYKHFKEAQRPDEWEQIKPNAGWIVAVFLFILLIVRDVLTRWITSVVEAFREWMYNQFAGNRLLRTIALRRYQHALFEKYGQLHIPFRPKDRPLQMRDVYVPLKVAWTFENETIEAYEAISEYQKLMIVGAPGSGKSMLCKNILFAYAEKRLRLPGQAIPVLVELHRLNNPKLSIEQHLAGEFARNNFPHAEKFISSSLKKGIFILLLDGLDEVSSKERDRIVQMIKDLLDKNRKIRVLITCRTAVYKDEFVGSADQTLEIMDFSDQQIRRFLQSWESDIPPDKSIEQLIQTLRDRPKIMSIARNPLLLTIIAYLYTDTPHELPHSRTEFYNESTDVLLRLWHREHNCFDARDKRTVLQHLALFYQNTAAQEQGDRRSVTHSTVVEQVRQILPRINLRDDQVDDILNEVVERSGLLLSIDGGQRYQFVHLTLQEFLAAEALINNTEELTKKFLNDPDGWRETVKLWCGITSDSSQLIQVIYENKPIMAFECLADAKNVEPALADEIVEYFKCQLHADSQNNAEIVRAFGNVASDTRPRGKAVFEFLKQSLQNFERQEQEDDAIQKGIAAGIALSFTNLPNAAKALAENYNVHHSIREALWRMGNIAVGQLSHLSQEGFTQALDDLCTIGTPEAAEQLLHLLWDDKKELTYMAAWRVASLLQNSSIENFFRNYPLTRQQRRADRTEWIWKPFHEPVDSTLPIIAGRVAYLIAHSPINFAPKEPLSIDPRISIPLYAIGARVGAQKNYLLETLNEPQRSTLSQRLSKIQRALKETDWINIAHSAEYNFATGWHNLAVLIVMGILSGITIFKMWPTISNLYSNLIYQEIANVVGILFTIWGMIVLWRNNWEGDKFVLVTIGWPFLFATIPFIIGIQAFPIILLFLLSMILFVLPTSVAIMLIFYYHITSSWLVGLGIIGFSLILNIQTAQIGINILANYWRRYLITVQKRLEGNLWGTLIAELLKRNRWLFFDIFGIGWFILIGYFSTAALLSVTTAINIILAWIGVVGVCSILLWRGRHHYNASLSPLRGILELSSDEH